MVERVEKSDGRLLPASKIRTIMKSCGDPNNTLSMESVVVVSKAAVRRHHLTTHICEAQRSTNDVFVCISFFQELFIGYLAQQTQHKPDVAREITYDDLAKFVQGTDKLEFLHEILPEKITVRQFRDILERGDEDSDSNSSGSEEESSISNDDDEEDDASDDEKEA